jgi:hypothetical protein
MTLGGAPPELHMRQGRADDAHGLERLGLGAASDDVAEISMLQSSRNVGNCLGRHLGRVPAKALGAELDLRTPESSR